MVGTKTVNYPPYAKVTNIHEETVINNRFRYYLEIELAYHKDIDHKTLIAIMMNPSKANTKYSDATVNKVIIDAYHAGYNEVIILNSLPIYQPQSKKITSIPIPNIVINTSMIINTLTNYLDSDILLATGDPHGQGISCVNIIHAFLRLYVSINNVWIYGLNKSTYTQHPRPRGKKHTPLFSPLMSYSYIK